MVIERFKSGFASYFNIYQIIKCLSINFCTKTNFQTGFQGEWLLDYFL